MSLFPRCGSIDLFFTGADSFLFFGCDPPLGGRNIAEKFKMPPEIAI
tara:strand:+ start:1238 stop:1378 length:141 start_codon:yes stop_codon:yes gene_type:complete